MYITYILERVISFHFHLTGTGAALRNYVHSERETRWQNWRITKQWSSSRPNGGPVSYIPAHEVPPLTDTEKEQVKAGILAQIAFTWPGE